jgi:thioredoxin:protein disulfide reductase
LYLALIKRPIMTKRLTARKRILMKSGKTAFRELDRRRRKAFVWGLMLLSALVMLLTVSALPSMAPTASVRAVLSQENYPAGGEYPVLFTVRVTDPWFLHGPHEADGMLATRLTFSGIGPIEITDVQFPSPKKVKFPYADQPLEVYEGEFTVPATLRVPESAKTGAYLIEAELTYQACTTTACRSPETVKIPFTVHIVASGVEAPSMDQSLSERAGQPARMPGRWSGFWLTILGIFLGGLALNLTPCIYPLIPITVSYFGGRGNDMAGHPFMHGAFYIIGLAITNAALGVIASLSGGLLGAVLQSSYVLVGVALVLVCLALSFFGFWELRVPTGLTSLVVKSYGGYFGTLFMGLTLGIVAAPCLGPFILGLLTVVAQKGDPVLGVIYFVVLSIGMGLPLAILGIFSGSMNKLPLSGDWMIWVRKLLGWVLLAMAAYMVSPLIPGGAIRAVLGAALFCAAAVHLGWLERSGKGSRFFTVVKRSFGLLCIAGASIYLYAGLQNHEGMRWMPYQPALVQEAARKGTPVILYFYADWCFPCRQMNSSVFTDPEVIHLGRQFVPLKIDLTREHPQQEYLQETYSLKGVPTIIFLDRRGSNREDLRIESYVDKEVMLDRMRDVLRQSSSK